MIQSSNIEQTQNRTTGMHPSSPFTYFVPPLYSPQVRLPALSQSHRCLEETLVQSTHCLRLHLSLQEESSQPDEDLRVGQLLKEHGQVRELFGDQLLRRQVLGEQNREMKEGIAHLEHRIGQLRVVLIGKEAEINFMDQPLGRDSLPKKQNIQLLSTFTAHNHAIAHYALERKKLEAEVEALQHVLATPATSQDSGCTSSLSHRSNDHIFERIIKAIEAEDARQSQFGIILRSLRKEEAQVSQKSQQGRNRYQALSKRDSEKEEKQENKEKQEKQEKKDNKEKSPVPFLGQWLTNIELNHDTHSFPKAQLKPRGSTLQRTRQRSKEN